MRRPAGFGILALAVALAGSSAATRAETCVVAGFDAVDAATPNGFTFTGEVVDGTGSCLWDETSFVVSGGNEDPGVTCELVWFGKRQLAEGWKVAGLEFDGPLFEFVTGEEPEWPSRTPQVRVRVVMAKGESDVLSLADMTLEGDDCDIWEEAFSRSAPTDTTDGSEDPSGGDT